MARTTRPRRPRDGRLDAAGPADVVTFMRRHNWADPASMEDLAGHFAFLAEHVASTTSSPDPRPTPCDSFSLVLHMTVAHCAQDDQA